MPTPKFQKGNPGNIKNHGGKKGKHYASIPELQLATSEAMQQAMTSLEGLNFNDMKKAINDSKLTGIALVIVSTYVHAVRNGDWHRVDKIFDRIFGKVKDRVEHSGSIDNKVIYLDPSLNPNNDAPV